MEDKKLEVLIVDDNLNQRKAAERQFSTADAKKGYNLTIAETYQSAVNTIRKNKYDALLTDLFFPFGSNEMGETYPISKEQAAKPEALGYPLALEALANGIKNIGIVSMVNHHDGAMAASYERVKNLLH